MASVIGSPIVAGATWLALSALIAWDSLRGLPRSSTQPTASATDADDQVSQQDQFTQARARIVAGPCGVLIVIIALVCARFVHDARLLIVILLAVSAICLAGILAYYELAARIARYWRGHWPAAAFAVLAMISCTAAVSFTLYPMIYPEPRANSPVPRPVPPPPPPPAPPPLPPSRPFSITPGWGIYAPSSGSGLSELAMLGQYEAGVGLQPINWLVHVTLANNRSDPTTIIGLWASAAKFDKPGAQPQWQRFCNVTLHQQRLFRLYPSLRDSTEYSTADSLDGRLADQTIAAHGSVSGWLAWYCPGHDCGTEAKLTIREANGEVSETAQFPLSSTAANLHDPLPDPVADHVDLSPMALGIVENCEHPESSGLMVLMPHN